jgi:hypothetical protein
MTTPEICRMITKTFNTLNEVDDISQLQNLGLSLYDFRECQRIMPELGQPGAYAKTIFSRVANFFESCGYKVIPDKIIGFDIITPTEDK